MEIAESQNPPLTLTKTVAPGKHRTSRHSPRLASREGVSTRRASYTYLAWKKLGISIVMGVTPVAGWFTTGQILSKWMIQGYPYFRKPPFARRELCALSQLGQLRLSQPGHLIDLDCPMEGLMDTSGIIKGVNLDMLKNRPTFSS